MKFKLLVLLCMIVLSANGQQAEGIFFEKGLSWAQIKEKAKKEDKYIFLDAYTTWCGPCKQMDKDIFPLEKVGDFFNAHFINVKVQFDVTEKDSEAVKQWYEDAKTLAKAYNINSYPTYLFFSPKGDLVHRIEGASKDGDEFIAKAEIGMSDYYKQKQKFKSGNSSVNELLSLIKTAQLMNDKDFIPVVTNAYLSAQHDLLTEENLKLIAVSTRKTSDPGFSVLRNKSEKADVVLGKGASRKLVATVIFDEVVLPHLRINGVKQDMGGGMFSYKGKVNEQADWTAIKRELDRKFPELTEEILMMSKPLYYQWLQNWPDFISAVNYYKDKMSKRQLNNYANHVFLFCKDRKALATAMGWSKQLLSGGDKHNIGYLSTYADLLYKSGKQSEAIKTMEQVVVLSGRKESYLTEQLAKMKKGEQTW